MLCVCVVCVRVFAAVAPAGDADCIKLITMGKMLIDAKTLKGRTRAMRGERRRGVYVPQRERERESETERERESERERERWREREGGRDAQRERCTEREREREGERCTEREMHREWTFSRLL